MDLDDSLTEIKGVSLTIKVLVRVLKESVNLLPRVGEVR